MSESDVRVGDRFRWEGSHRKGGVWTIEKLYGSYSKIRCDDGRYNDQYRAAYFTEDGAEWTRLPREQPDRPACTADACYRDGEAHECPLALVRQQLADAETMRPKPGQLVYVTAGQSITLSPGLPRDFTLKFTADGMGSTLTWGDGIKPPAQPAKCKPGCSPAEPCRTEAVCPVFKEDEHDRLRQATWDKHRMVWLAWDGAFGGEGATADEAMRAARENRQWLAQQPDLAEARAWRSQRHEPSISGLAGGFVGSWNKRAVR